ncbi:MAG TPA: GTPase [Candidatus Nanoarchaeia archaeon]|nr:GTPase [Candidatus Nanoarchaeia archaeon]
MRFNSIPPVPNAQTLLDIVFRKTRDAAQKARPHSGHAVHRKEQKRVIMVADTLRQKLITAIKSFSAPSTPFYKELMSITIDDEQYNQALSGVRLCIERLDKVKSYTLQRLEKAPNVDRLRRAYYGRISAIIKKTQKSLAYLEQVRRIMRDFPMIQDMPTAAIAGFPNVGKTTLLNKLTQSNAEVAAYAFTTTSINSGFFSVGSTAMQLLDTPGTLARLDKMNDIEKQAYCAMKHCADIIVYVFDPTEEYPLAQQERLFEIVKALGKPVLLYLSKTDRVPEHQFKKRYPNIIISIDELKEKIYSLLRLAQQGSN